MTGRRDETAYEAIGRVGRGTRTHHAFGCRVDGGPRTHGRGGFRCGKCTSLAEEDREADLLAQLERYAGATR